MSDATLLLESIESGFVPSPVEYAVLLPPDYSENGEPVPLFLFLHGGGGSREFLTERMRPVFESLWAQDLLPPMAVATPSAGRSFYLNYHDGSQNWEEFILAEFLGELRSRFNVRLNQAGTLVGGISMGGLGSLRLAFKHPGTFSVVVALEPGIDPAFSWEDVGTRHRFYRPPRLLQELFGQPLDAAHWAKNNPASIARDNAAAVRDAGLGVYIEVGDEDFLNLNEGTEFLHRVLWDNGIRHEYRLVYGGNHVGRTVPPRFLDAFGFLDRHLRPDTAPDIDLEQATALLGGAAKVRAEEQSPPWRGEFAP